MTTPQQLMEWADAANRHKETELHERIQIAQVMAMCNQTIVLQQILDALEALKGK